MRRFAAWLALSTLWLAGAAAVSADPPRRIASLNLAADEILAELVPPERLVAVTHASDDPLSSMLATPFPEDIPRFFRADMERLLALEPDLVIISEYTDADFVRLLEDSGLRHHRMGGLSTHEGIRAALIELGEVVGEGEGGRRLVAAFDARLAGIRDRLSGAERRRVLYWSDPYTAGAGTAIGSLIECAGGSNVAAELGLEGVLPLGAERAFVADPDVFLLGRFGEEASSLSDHPLLSRSRAVREGHVVALPTPLLVTLSHHAAAACETLAARLHPERFAAADGT